MVAGVVILGLILIASFLTPGGPEKKTKKGVVIITEKEEYKRGEELKVKIENNIDERICFSSCYPYYMQKRNGEWVAYLYEECEKEDMIEKCVEPKQAKAFELTVPKVDLGPHRLAIGACIGCQLNETFKKDKNLFSNIFIVE